MIHMYIPQFSLKGRLDFEPAIEQQTKTEDCTS